MGLSKSLGYQRVVTYAFIPIAALWTLKINHFQFSSFKSFYLKIYLSIILLSLLFFFQSVDPEQALISIIQLFGVFLTAIIALEIVAYKKEDLTEWILLSFVVGFYISIFFLQKSLAEEVTLTTRWIDRSQYDLNANKYSYFSFISNFAIFYLILLKKRKIYYLLSVATIIIGIQTSFLTASRSGVLLTGVFGIIFWLLISQPKMKKVFGPIKFIAVIIFIFFASIKVYDTYENSYLRSRVERANEEGESRVDIAFDALRVFFEHPFNGVGPSQFSNYAVYAPGRYSHNSYLEAATNLGFLGFIIVFILFFKPITDNFRNKRLTHSIRLLNLMFFGGFLIYNNLYVFYWSSIEMMFFFFVIGMTYRYANHNELTLKT